MTVFVHLLGLGEEECPLHRLLEEGLVLEEGDELFWVAGAAEGEKPRA